MGCTLPWFSAVAELMTTPAPFTTAGCWSCDLAARPDPLAALAVGRLFGADRKARAAENAEARVSDAGFPF
jgi:hypothetical protein